MHELKEADVGCPYCGERIPILLDPSIDHQEYVEDCQVCCRPIVFTTAADGLGDVNVTVRSENE